MDLVAGLDARRASVEALIRTLFDARMSRDVERSRPYLAPDIVYRMVGHRSYSPFSGEFRGPDAVIKGVRELNIEFEYQEMKIDRILIDGDNVAIRWHGRWRNRGTGASADFEGFAHLVFKDGKVAEYTNFVDTALAANIAGWG